MCTKSLLAMFLVLGIIHGLPDSFLPGYCKSVANGGDYKQDYNYVELKTNGPSLEFAQIISLTNGSVSSTFVSDSAKKMAASFVLIALAVISFIIFLFYCCCCDRYSGASRCVQIVLSIIVFVAMAAIIVLMIINAVKVTKFPLGVNNILCSILEFPLVLIKGNSTDAPTFLGFDNLINVMNNLLNDFSGFSKYKNDLTTISNSDVKTSTQTCIKSLNDFNATTTTTYLSWDSVSVKAVPLSINAYNSDGAGIVMTEFTTLDVAATQIVSGAKSGVSMFDSFNISSIKDAIQPIIDNLNNIKQNVNSFGSNINDISNTLNEKSPLIVGIFAGLLALVVALSGVITLFILFALFRGQDCCRCCIKLFMVLTALIVILYALLSTVFFGITLMSNSVCEGVSQIMTSDDISATLANLGVTVPSDLNQFVNTCLSKTATGDLSTFLPDTKGFLGQIESLFSGINQMDQIQSVITQSGGKSVTITKLIDSLADIKAGKIPDHTNVVASLGQLNNLISCSGASVALSNAGCGSTAGCIGLAENSYSAPACATDATAVNNLVTNIKKYISEESTMLNMFITNISTATNSPGANAQIVYSKFQSIINTFKNAKNSIQNTINSAQQGLDIKKNYNCTILRAQVVNISTNICVGLAGILNGITIILIVFLYIVLALLWCSCCVLQYTPAEPSAANAQPPQIIYVNQQTEGAALY